MGDIIGIAFVVVFFGALLLLLFFSHHIDNNTDGQDHNMDWHRRNGQWQVLYPDGKLSQPFSCKVAEDYAGMFGGTVIPKK